MHWCADVLAISITTHEFMTKRYNGNFSIVANYTLIERIHNLQPYYIDTWSSCNKAYDKVAD